MGDAPVSFRWSEGQDRDGAKLRAFLEVQRSLEAAGIRRWILVWVLIGLSVPVWLSAAWPAAMGRLRAVSLACWVICAANLLAAALAERRWYKRRAALAEDMDGKSELP